MPPLVASINYNWSFARLHVACFALRSQSRLSVPAQLDTVQQAVRDAAVHVDVVLDLFAPPFIGYVTDLTHLTVAFAAVLALRMLILFPSIFDRDAIVTRARFTAKTLERDANRPEYAASILRTLERVELSERYPRDHAGGGRGGDVDVSIPDNDDIRERDPYWTTPSGLLTSSKDNNEFSDSDNAAPSSGKRAQNDVDDPTTSTIAQHSSPAWSSLSSSSNPLQSQSRAGVGINTNPNINNNIDLDLDLGVVDTTGDLEIDWSAVATSADFYDWSQSLTFLGPTETS
jgi:hypothetical protein